MRKFCFYCDLIYRRFTILSHLDNHLQSFTPIVKVQLQGLSVFFFLVMFITSPNSFLTTALSTFRQLTVNRSSTLHIEEKRASSTSFYSGHKEQYDAFWVWHLDMSLLRPAAAAPHRNNVNIAHCGLSVKFWERRKYSECDPCLLTQ